MKTILVDAVYTFVIEGRGIYQPMHELLEQYQNRKIILTGADDKSLVKYGLDKMPYEIFTLKHDPEKSDPDYYKKMLAHFGLVASDVVYFEHAPAAVESARSVGITVYQYDPDAKDIPALKAFLDTNL